MAIKKSSWNKGLKLSEEHKKKISETFLKKNIQPNYKYPLNHKPWNKGVKRTLSEKKNMRLGALRMWRRRKAALEQVLT